MTTRLRRVVLFSLLCLTTFATSAAAARAWVLWKQPATLKGGDDGWELWAAYPALTSCTQALDSREAEARKGMPFTDISRRAPTDLFLMFREDKSGIFTSGITWQCLPDTVDPRGPREK
jgi:hypothetical protein